MYICFPGTIYINHRKHRTGNPTTHAAKLARIPTTHAAELARQHAYDPCSEARTGEHGGMHIATCNPLSAELIRQGLDQVNSSMLATTHTSVPIRK